MSKGQRYMMAAVGLAALLACTPANVSVPGPAARAGQAPLGPQRPVAPVTAASAPEMVAPAQAARIVSAPAEPALASFAGRWLSHSFTLDIDTHGTGVAAWRTYRWCSSAPPPCDDMQADFITPGGRATLVVHRAEAGWADADVVSSTHPSSVPLGPARLLLVGDGRLQLLLEAAASAHGLPINLCRPGAFRSTACGA